MRRHGSRTISSPGLSWRRCWSRLELPTRRHLACRVSTVFTQRSSRCWPTRCSGQAASRPGTGLGSGRRHPWRRSSIVGWRSRPRRHFGRHDGDRFWGGLHSGGHRAAGFCDRASFQANTLRLHERNCIDRIDQSTAKALRLFHRECRTPAEPVGDRRREFLEER